MSMRGERSVQVIAQYQDISAHPCWEKEVNIVMQGERVLRLTFGCQRYACAGEHEGRGDDREGSPEIIPAPSLVVQSYTEAKESDGQSDRD